MNEGVTVEGEGGLSLWQWATQELKLRGLGGPGLPKAVVVGMCWLSVLAVRARGSHACAGG